MSGNKKNITVIIVIIVGVALLVTFFALRVYAKERIVTIGIARWVSNPEYDRNIQGFKSGLVDAGFIEGVNIRYIIENPEADKAVQRNIIQSFIDKKVDLVYSLTTPGTLIAKEMITDTPIVFSIVTYPVEAGIIESTESSGNNLVGTRNYISVSRQFNQITRVVENAKNIAFIHRKDEPNSVIQEEEFGDYLKKQGIEIYDVAAVTLDDIRSRLSHLINEMDALYAACDTLIQSGGEELVIQISKIYGKPSFTCNKDGVLKGALIGNVADFYNIGKLSGDKAALILRGAKPSQLFTDSHRGDYLMVNLNTAAELGIDITKDVLNDAKEIILHD
ncbi:hypothetical protein COB64_03235 [Candidatus Wolfebacteria bacterium]|nr:MAG: hypothetical protein COB64_03235 [Candidatus Wolfebacteria bacterium]